MKRLTMAAAAVLVAGSALAQTAPPLVQVYDFMANVRNSNVGTRTDRRTGMLCDYKFSGTSSIGGFLVVPDCTDCGYGAGNAWLYLYRLRDTTRTLYRVAASFALVDAFATSSNVEGITLGREAEGFLVVNPMTTGDNMVGFFNRDRDQGNTKFWAAGFGRISQGKGHYEEIPSEDPCIPSERIWVPGCITLDTLSGQIVGLLEYDFVCNAPYLVLCADVVDCVNDTQNAVFSGSWQIRRNRSLESTSVYDAEDKIIQRLSNFTPNFELDD